MLDFIFMEFLQKFDLVDCGRFEIGKLHIIINPQDKENT